MGKRCCRFRFRLDLRRGLVYVQVLGWKKGARNVIRLRIQLKEMGIDGDPTQGTGEGRKPPTVWLTPKAPKRNNRTSHQPQKKEKLTSNIQHAMRNQCRKFISLLIDIIPPSSFNDIMALPPASSFFVRQHGLLIVYWFSNPVTSVCCERRRNMGGRGKLDLR